MAKQVAFRWLRDGTKKFNESVTEDRRIQASKFWPKAPTPALPGRLMAVTPDVGKLIDEAIAWERERHAEIVQYARMVRISATWACCLEAAVKEYDAAALPAQPDKPKEGGPNA